MSATATVVIDKDNVVRALLQLLRAERFMDIKTSYALAYAMGSMGPDIAPLLLDAVRDESEAVRVCAGVALRILGRNAGESVPTLKEALNHSDENVRLAAAIAMLQAPRPSQIWAANGGRAPLQAERR